MNASSTPEPRRRTALKYLAALFGGAIGGLAAIPGLALLAHPLRRRTIRGAEAVPAATLATLRSDRPMRVELTGSRQDAWQKADAVHLGSCWLLRGPDGPRAFSTVCPHLGCGVDWSEGNSRFECPCHTSAFAVDGRALGGPSARGLDELQVTVERDLVFVRPQRFKLGGETKEPLE